MIRFRGLSHDIRKPENPSVEEVAKTVYWFLRLHHKRSSRCDLLEETLEAVEECVVHILVCHLLDLVSWSVHLLSMKSYPRMIQYLVKADFDEVR